MIAAHTGPRIRLNPFPPLMVLAVAVTILNGLADLSRSNGLPQADSGAFATIGQGIVHGLVPYRDFWDHKPPGIYYLDALVLATAGATPWSLYVAGIGANLLSLAAFAVIMLCIVPRVWASFGVVVFAALDSLPSVDIGGNLTEIYWQVFVLGAMAVLLSTLARTIDRNRTRVLCVATLTSGVCMGFACLFKPQALFLVPVVATACFLSIRRLQASIVLLSLPFVGMLAVLLPAGVYFLFQGAGPDMWSQLVVYNQVYSSVLPLVPQLPVLVLLGPSTVALLVLAGCATVRVLWLDLTFPGNGEHDLNIVVVLVLWFVASLLATSSDRHFFAHDGLFSIGSAVAITVYSLSRRPQASQSHPTRLVSRGVWLALMFSTAALLAFAWASIPKGITVARELRMGRHSSYVATAPRLLAAPFTPGQTEFPLLSVGPWQLVFAPQREDSLGLQSVTRVIVEHSRPSDYVEVWGLEPSLYFLSGRRPASRFLYSLPLTGNFGGVHARGYKSGGVDKVFLHDLADHPPALIVLASVDRDPVSTLPSFAAMLHHTYRRLVTLDGFDVYSRS